jgi:hypothetical protein
VQIVAIAGIVMSLDNVIAVAAAANDSVPLLVIGAWTLERRPRLVGAAALLVASSALPAFAKFPPVYRIEVSTTQARPGDVIDVEVAVSGTWDTGDLTGVVGLYAVADLDGDLRPLDGAEGRPISLRYAGRAADGRSLYRGHLEAPDIPGEYALVDVFAAGEPIIDLDDAPAEVNDAAVSDPAEPVIVTVTAAGTRPGPWYLVTTMLSIVLLAGVLTVLGRRRLTTARSSQHACAWRDRETVAPTPLRGSRPRRGPAEASHHPPRRAVPALP